MLLSAIGEKADLSLPCKNLDEELIFEAIFTGICQASKYLGFLR